MVGCMSGGSPSVRCGPPNPAERGVWEAMIEDVHRSGSETRAEPRPIRLSMARSPIYPFVVIRVIRGQVFSPVRPATRSGDLSVSPAAGSETRAEPVNPCACTLSGCRTDLPRPFRPHRPGPLPGTPGFVSPGARLLAALPAVDAPNCAIRNVPPASCWPSKSHQSRPQAYQGFDVLPERQPLEGLPAADIMDFCANYCISAREIIRLM
jgi:hypothetical protein